jgi:hypothetical protein
MRNWMFSLIAVSGMFATGFLTTEAIAKNKSIWCMVDKKSGDFSSSCYKTKEQCMKEARKKGMTCGMTFE